MRSIPAASRHTPQLAAVSTYGVQELTVAEAMATNGGVIPLFGVIAAIVAADAAILSAGIAALAYFSARADKGEQE